MTLEEWVNVKQPGPFGKDRDRKYEMYSKEYGEGNWRLRWKWGNNYISFEQACKIYEMAYFIDSFNREEPWELLMSMGRDVYDTNPNNVESGLDYTIQKNSATNIQDIAIRNVIYNRGLKFEGDQLIQVRKHGDFWGNNFSPGKVKFHRPDVLDKPYMKGWWDELSVEHWYQQAKWLQVRKI